MGKVKKYELEEKFLAFIDILGFKNIVMENRNPEIVMIAIEKAENKILKYKKNSKLDELNVTWFSDSLVISISNYEIDALYTLIKLVNEIQSNLLVKNILIRGAISLGECYHNKNNVYGKCMVQAYELECKVAVTPRVIISKEIIKYLEREHTKEEEEIDMNINYGVGNGLFESDELIRYSLSKTTSEKITSYLLRMDKDGYYYIDYLRTLYNPCIETVDMYKYEVEHSYDKGKQEGTNNFEVIENWYADMVYPIREFIIKESNNPNMNIALKYLWVKDYFNSTIDSFSQYNLSDRFKSTIYNEVMKKI